ncbi:LysR family transcriptional regulator [Vibrio crassostreae]|uniref:LysR family transcriptional regulator n=1 Tax=Vibrio crassostreae TaxID=246167 RepID=UPI001B301FCC|nr:LysR family transcriptional regulator [Vibrio crassostreae]
MIDLNLLKTFSAIYNTGSVRAASEMMNLTSSAVSHALNRLRAEYDNPLFVREGRGLKPTTYAVELYKEIAPHLSALEGTKKIFEKFDPATSDRTFFVAGDSDLDLWYFHKLSEIAEREAPNVKIVKYQSENSEETFNNALSMRKADILLSVVNPANKSYSVETVGSDKIIAIAKKGHPRIHGKMTMETFLSESHACWSRPDINENSFEELFEGKIPCFKTIYWTGAAMNLIFMVSEKEWISVIPEFLYKKTQKLDLVEAYDLPFKCKEFPIFLVNHKTTDRDKGVIWLKEKIREAFK